MTKDVDELVPAAIVRSEGGGKVCWQKSLTDADLRAHIQAKCVEDLVYMKSNGVHVITLH